MFGITLNPAKLEVGMTMESINSSDASARVKNKQIELFNKYNTTPDDVIDWDEFNVYEKDYAKKERKEGMTVLGISLAVMALLGACVGFNHLKNKKALANDIKESFQPSVKRSSGTKTNATTTRKTMPDKVQPPVKKAIQLTRNVTEIKPENINFTYTDYGYRTGIGNSRDFNSIAGKLDYDGYLQSSQYAKEHGFYPFHLKEYNKTGIMIPIRDGVNGHVPDPRGGNITVYIDGILKKEQIETFAPMLKRKFYYGNHGLEVNKNELAEMFNNMQHQCSQV